MLPSDAGTLLQRFEDVEQRRRVLYSRNARRRRSIARLLAEQIAIEAEIRSSGEEIAALRKKLCTSS